MTETDTFETRLTTMLHRVADTATVDDRAFDPSDAVAPIEVLHTAPMKRTGPARAHRPAHRPTHRPVRRLLVAAIALVVVAILAAVAVVASDERSDVTTVHGVDTRVLIPSATPAGMVLWSVDVAPSSVDDLADNVWWPPRTGPLTSQHFQTTDGTVDVLVEIAAPRQEALDPGCCDAHAALRGLTGRIDVSMGPLPPPEDPPTWSTIVWTEQGRELQALFPTAQRDAVVALLDHLVPRDPANLQAGFDPGSASPAALEDEAVRAGTPHVPNATFVYAAGPPDGAGQPGITARTSLGTGPGDIDGFGWVRRAMQFPRQPDGSIALIVQNGGAETAYRPDAETPSGTDAFRTVEVIWPDGRWVVVTGRGQSPTTLHDLAMSVSDQPIDSARAMAEQATARVLATPLVAAADLPSGRVELRGEPAHPGALCLRSATGKSSCARVADWFGFPFSLITGSVVLDGQWFVAAAAPQQVQVQADTSGDPAATATPPPSTPSEIPVESTTEGDWHILLAPMPADWDRVAVAFGDGRGGGCSQPDSVTCSVTMSQRRPSAW